MKGIKPVLLTLILLTGFSCTKEKETVATAPVKENGNKISAAATVAAVFLENFETGTKAAYATGDVVLSTGTWTLNDALLGTSASDPKNGLQSVRVRNSGIATMKFDFISGASTVTVMHAKYGTDANGTWQLWYSTNGGTSFTQAGSTISTTTTTLQAATFTINVSGNIRFEIRKTDAGTNRINFDDFTINGYSGTSNPVPALTSISPSSAVMGSAAFTLTLNGNNFMNGSVVNWNGTALATTFTSATQLSAAVPATNISAAGTVSVTIFNPAPGGGTSSAQTFTITSNPVPVLTSMSPSSATAGSPAFVLTVTGSNFMNGSAIKWNGTSLITTYISGTQLSASIPAANVATAGTASVTVFNPAPGGGTSSTQTFTISNVVTGAKKFLFDATKAETAGNADWVIDEDASPQRIPTPAQSTITSSTSETYWKGAISSWGIALVKSGNSVETLPSGTAITYGNVSNAQDLSHYDVFVVDEPNTRFTAAEKVAILNFVNAGGGLFMISDHTISDRNNDGWDSPAIWNDLMTNNTVQNNPFGFSIDLTNISQVSSNVLSGNSSNTILHGSQGNVTQMQFNNGATITINPSANSTVQGLIWQNSYAQNTTHIMCASSAYGAGRVFCVTDSSPMDDGTGASGNTLFVSWPLYSHAKLFMNASLWLAKLQ
ncbi:MAG: IPT/TIG domain-containing protein [Bacteroidetes bacterium]|nr:IPT/TIG domain-containing protein [Bacteroidota bacterium]